LEERLLRIRLKRKLYVPNVPLGNYIIMALAVVSFFIQFTYDAGQEYLSGLVLEGWSFRAILGHMWLHANLPHIVWNLLTLYIFGRHVCSKMGNANFILAYFFVGIFSAFAHIAYDGRPAIGSSGAIMGVLGLHVVLCFERFGFFGPWIVLVWFLLSLTAAFVGILPTAHLSHVGGFVGGLMLASAMSIFHVAAHDSAPTTENSP
jgi:membrane associated rhomboid family serine protease